MSRRRTPLRLDDEALANLSPEQVADHEQRAITRMMTTKRLTFEQWDALVTHWNEELNSEERLARHVICRDKGHDWARAPIDAQVCRRCCSYVITMD